jgi:serine/threonine protein kinase
MSAHRPNAFNSLRMGEVIREKVQDGITGETRDLQYTQCKIVGNGSFGVVFQTKLSPSGEDAAIKRVLQDKRFKVCTINTAYYGLFVNLRFRTVNYRLCVLSVTPTSSSSRPSTTPMANVRMRFT